MTLAGEGERSHGLALARAGRPRRGAARHGGRATGWRDGLAECRRGVPPAVDHRHLVPRREEEGWGRGPHCAMSPPRRQDRPCLTLERVGAEAGGDQAEDHRHCALCVGRRGTAEGQMTLARNLSMSSSSRNSFSPSCSYSVSQGLDYASPSSFVVSS